MTIKNDKWIREMSKKFGMISPFCEATREVKGEKVISYGLSSFGYDARLGNMFMVPQTHLDPKNSNDSNFMSVEAAKYRLNGNSFVLAHTMETFKIPRDVLAICTGKSTYARCGILVNILPLEPEWEGQITMAISNVTAYPVTLYGGEGIAQIVFHKSDESCEISYRDKKGKYQNSKGIMVSKV